MWTPESTGAVFILSLGLFENLLVLGLFLRSARHGLRPPSKKLRPSKIIQNPSTPKARETLKGMRGKQQQKAGGSGGVGGNMRGPPLHPPLGKPRFNFSPGIDLSVVGLTTAHICLCASTLLTLWLSNGTMVANTRLCDLQAFFVSWLEVAVLSYSCLLAAMRYKFIVRQQGTHTRSFMMHSVLIWGVSAVYAGLGSRMSMNVPGTSGIVCYPFGSLETVAEVSFLWAWTVRCACS